MAAVSKKKMAQKKAKRAQNKIKKREREDSLGISRKAIGKTMEPKLFITLKIVSIIAPCVCYFFFSRLLFACMIFSAVLLYAAILTEKYHNATFIKANHIKIPKIDCILAIIVMIIVIVGGIISSNTKMKIPFMKQRSEFIQKLENICTCLTGRRRMIFRPGKFKKFDFDMNFGTEGLPEGMKAPGKPPGGRPPEFDMADLPVKSLFSTITSTIITILIFLVPSSSALVLYLYKKKSKKFNKMMDEVIADEYVELSDEDYYRIFTFDGVVIEDFQLEDNNINTNLIEQEKSGV